MNINKQIVIIGSFTQDLFVYTDNNSVISYNTANGCVNAQYVNKNGNTCQKQNPKTNRSK
jgi:hypothetical protein